MPIPARLIPPDALGRRLFIKYIRILYKILTTYLPLKAMLLLAMDESMSDKEAQMGKRAFAWITLASFLVFSWSCYSWQKQSLQSLNPEKREGVMISAVQTISGERINLNKNPAALIKADSVVGQQFVNGWVLFSKPLSEINFVWIRKLNVPVTLLVGVAIPLIVGAILYAITVDTTNKVLTSILRPVS